MLVIQTRAGRKVLTSSAEVIGLAELADLIRIRSAVLRDIHASVWAGTDVAFAV